MGRVSEGLAPVCSGCDCRDSEIKELRDALKAEREACAKTADRHLNSARECDGPMMVTMIAAAIRQRS
jgi:hypothetical protein